MKVKTVSILLSLFLVTTLCMNFLQSVSATWFLVPNGGFESGTVGLIPDNWVMKTYEAGVSNTTYVHEMQQTDQKYFEGAKSLWLHARVVDTDGLKLSRISRAIAETEDWINAPFATHVRIYVRDIKSTHSALGWGWGNCILLHINNMSVPKPYCAGRYWDYIFAHGETCNQNNYNYTVMGADEASWYVYEYSIPESVDRTHMKLQISCHACDWTFYSTSYFSDLEFVVDKVELFSLPPQPPQYTLAIDSSPTGVTFTVDDVSHTTPWSGAYYEGTSVEIVMPETHAGYVWSHWLEDGDTNRIKTITLPGTTWTGVFITAPPLECVGGEMVLVDNIKLTPSSLISPLTILVSTIILATAISVTFVRHRKKRQI
jgi:hypothetical protein